MGYQVNLLVGIGQYLHAQNVGYWLTSGTYKPTDVAITVDILAPTPDKGIAMSLYPVADEGGTDSVIGLQLRIRGNPGDRVSAKDICDRAFDVLHGLRNTVIGGTNVVLIERTSGANLGPDGNNRQEHTENYYIRVTRPGTHRTD